MPIWLVSFSYVSIALGIVTALIILGFMTTYPANWLLVRSGVKSAM
jgi:hypothetical protein